MIKTINGSQLITGSVVWCDGQWQEIRVLRDKPFEEKILVVMPNNQVVSVRRWALVQVRVDETEVTA